MVDLGLKAKRKKEKKLMRMLMGILSSKVQSLNRNFRAEKPNEKWYTDITEFSLPDGKVCLSSSIDGFDGMPVVQTFGTLPNEELANTRLEKSIGTLREGEHPILLICRGCHWRWTE